ncbi:MAG TPA: cache domain-containing protein [Microlunatus sp.]|nr:cache domain-containing protein [Microlunatus sp.]
MTAEQAAIVISQAVDRVFATVSRVRGLVLATHRAATERGDVLHERDIDRLRPSLLELLAENPTAIGLGVIFAPGLLPERGLGLEWWQSAPDLSAPSRLEVDLRADSLDFYDYASAEWFVQPQQTGERHVAGPYVDVHGTDRYLLTFTEPVVAAGTFLGVVGADVPVARFETLVLHGLADLPVDIVVIGEESRVVLSTRSRWLAGELLAPDATPDRIPLPGLTWQLAVTESGR